MPSGRYLLSIRPPKWVECCELSLIRINPKPIRIIGIITKLIRSVNHFIGT